MKKNVLSAVLAVVFVAGSALASAAPQTYTIDPTHTASRFGYNHLNWTRQQHRFNSTTGKITLDQEAKTASVDVSIDVKSLNTGFETFDGHLLYDSGFFDVGSHPKITFKSTKVKFEGDKVVGVEGDLTIKGITKPVTLTLQSFQVGTHPAQRKKESIGVNATAMIKRSDFGMGQIPAVSDEVDLSFAVQAFKD